MRRFLKFLHTVGAFGVAGGMAAFMLLLANGPPVAATAEYLSLRQGLDLLSGWLILPSMAVVLVSGVLAMAVHFPFHNAGWVWIKAATGILLFEVVFAAVDGPAASAAKAAGRAVAGEISQSELVAVVSDKWVAWWVLLLLAGLNVVLAIWRPRFIRRQPAAAPAD